MGVNWRTTVIWEGCGKEESGVLGSVLQQQGSALCVCPQLRQRARSTSKKASGVGVVSDVCVITASCDMSEAVMNQQLISRASILSGSTCIR